MTIKKKELYKEYKEKNNIMLKTLEKYCPYPFYLDEAYLCYHIELPSINEEKLKILCHQKKIAVNPIKNHQLALSFASIPSSHIQEAILTIVLYQERQTLFMTADLNGLKIVKQYV